MAKRSGIVQWYVISVAIRAPRVAHRELRPATRESSRVGEVPAEATLERDSEWTRAVARPVITAPQPDRGERLAQSRMVVEEHLGGAFHLLRRADETHLALPRLLER